MEVLTGFSRRKGIFGIGAGHRDGREYWSKNVEIYLVTYVVRSKNVIEGVKSVLLSPYVDVGRISMVFV